MELHRSLEQKLQKLAQREINYKKQYKNLFETNCCVTLEVILLKKA